MKLCKKERDKIFSKFRWDGIVQYNRHEATLDTPKYQSEKKAKNSKPLTRCNHCNVTVTKSNFSRHQKKCRKKTENPVVSVPLILYEVPSLDSFSKGYRENILSKLRDDKIGKICRTDQTILYLGSKMYWKLQRKKDKKTEVCRGVRADMRRLAHLYDIFRKQDNVINNNSNSLDMFDRENYDQLASAIEQYTKTDTEDSIKAGLKQNLYYLIKRAATVMQYSFYAQRKDQEAEEMSKFICTFKSWEMYLFGDATYHLNKQRLVNLRKPAKLPVEEDLAKLRDHLINRMSELCNNYNFDDSHSYIELRDVVCTRLTLLNGRRVVWVL